jgi:pyruvate,orthophosphate dikinase
VARGWGIPAVVGAADVDPGTDGVTIGATRLAAGDEITIDGSTGEVFAGRLEGVERPMPEVETLSGWARELGIDVGSAPEQPSDAPAVEPTPELAPPSDADVLRSLAVRGQCEEPALADALVVPAADLEPILERLAHGGALDRDGGVRLTPAGRVSAQSAFGAERDRLGEAWCATALDEFHALDGRMKAIVTDWQVRDEGGGQALNDHADPAYDEGVLDRLAALHADVAVWLDGWDPEARAMRAYRARLALAVDRARGGDHRYVASPRVDSYHGAWFELHEELIRLAGRSRADVSDG